MENLPAVSSLTIHHLDGSQKKQLYKDMFKMLAPGGALIIADIILPVGLLGQQLAAETWDNIVQKQAIDQDGHDGAFKHFRDSHGNMFRYPEPMNKPSGIFEQLKWVEDVGFIDADVYWLKAGQAIYGGSKK